MNTEFYRWPPGFYKLEESLFPSKNNNKVFFIKDVIGATGYKTLITTNGNIRTGVFSVLVPIPKEKWPQLEMELL